MQYVIVIMGKSFSGKSYLQNKLVEAGFPKMITATTRPKRQGEQEGKDYYFVKRVEKGALALRKYHVANGQEWDYYLPTSEFSKMTRDNPVSTLILDLKGYLELRKAAADYPSIRILGLFLNVPLKERLRRYLDTNRSKEDGKEFVRRLYDDEMRAFREIGDPQFCQDNQIMLMSNLDLILEVLNDLNN